jgi:hypothetical protein
MSLVLLAFLAAAASTPDDEVKVREWGVVLYRGEVVTAAGSPGGPWYDWSDAVAEAPVVFFRGPEFTGRFTVTSPARIFNVYPEPDDGVEVDLGWVGCVSSATWEGLSGRALEPGEQPWSDCLDVDIPGFQWAIPTWRVQESLVLRRSSDSWCDRFLYYEVDLSGTAFPLPLPGAGPEPEDPALVVSGQIMVFHRDEFGNVSMEIAQAEERSVASEEVVVPSRGYASEGAFDILLSWIGPNLTVQDAQVLWATWEPYILWGDWQGESLTVFPIPQSLLDRISTLDLQVEGGLSVNYGRFFLGMAETP